MNKKTDCKCKNWATDGRLPLLSHHHSCEKYDPVTEMIEIIKDLISGIEKWGAEEDGIFDECFEAYERAKISVGQFDFMQQ